MHCVAVGDIRNTPAVARRGGYTVRLTVTGGGRALAWSRMEKPIGGSEMMMSMCGISMTFSNKYDTIIKRLCVILDF